jgi:hypothetical protein
MSNQELKTKEKIDLVDQSMFTGQTTGFEETNNETFKTPFLKVLQTLSPEIKKKSENFIEGAEEGMFFNTATLKPYSELNIVVLKVVHNLVVWRPNRGGFVGVFDKSQELKLVYRKEGAKKWDKDENIINDTISFFCLNADKPSEIFVFPMSNASIKHAKSFSTRLRMLEANGKPLGVSFAGIWNIKTVLEENDKGSWYDVGNTPTFKRFITKEEFESYVKPALELLKKAETDYSEMESKTENVVDATEY